MADVRAALDYCEAPQGIGRVLLAMRPAEQHPAWSQAVQDKVGS
jgi:hypothetical protein